MLRLASCFLGLTLCVGLVGCDTGGPPEGTPKDVQGNVQPPGFEDMMKKTGGAMGKPATSTKSSAKEAEKAAEKPAEKAAEKPAEKAAEKK